MPQMEPCPKFKERSTVEPGICRYWEDRNPHVPPHCKHPAGMICETRGLKYPARDDSDDDGCPD
jgi:hypothetical protein